MAWHKAGDKPSPEAMMTQLNVFSSPGLNVLLQVLHNSPLFKIAKQ